MLNTPEFTGNNFNEIFALLTPSNRPSAQSPHSRLSPGASLEQTNQTTSRKPQQLCLIVRCSQLAGRAFISGVSSDPIGRDGVSVGPSIGINVGHLFKQVI